jgi:MFS family permease
MSTPPSPPPSLSPQRILATVWLAVFSSSLFFRAVDPIIPQIAADLSEPAGTVALLATAFTLPYALMQPALGAMGDVLGKTRTMFACLVIVTIATFAGAFAWNPLANESAELVRVIAGAEAGDQLTVHIRKRAWSAVHRVGPAKACRARRCRREHALQGPSPHAQTCDRLRSGE